MSKQAAGQIRLFLVDDHHLVRRGLRLLLGHEPGFLVCGEACNIAKALQGIRDTKPDVAIVDLSLGNEDGFELIEELHRSHRDVQLLVFSMHEKMLLAEKALSLGAQGFLLKSEQPHKIVEAIRAVATGLRYLSPSVDRVLLDATAGLEWMSENGTWSIRPRANR
jgi:DNA-binding NarL/FixJ family response regulator